MNILARMLNGIRSNAAERDAAEQARVCTDFINTVGGGDFTLGEPSLPNGNPIRRYPLLDSKGSRRGYVEALWGERGNGPEYIAVNLGVLNTSRTAVSVERFSLGQFNKAAEFLLGEGGFNDRPAPIGRMNDRFRPA